MDTSVLQSFLTIAQTGSFSTAAEQLHLTQPAISKRIANFESHLSKKVFDRVGRKILLTEAGEKILPRVQHILSQQSALKEDIAELGDVVEGSLTMGTSHHIGLHHLPPILRQYNQSYPKVELDLHFIDSEAACLAVEQGTLALAIVTLPSNPSKQLVCTPIWQDPLTVVVSKDHPLAFAPCLFETLVEFPALLPNEGTFTRAIVKKALQPLDLTLNIGLTTNY